MALRVDMVPFSPRGSFGVTAQRSLLYAPCTQQRQFSPVKTHVIRQDYGRKNYEVSRSLRLHAAITYKDFAESNQIALKQSASSSWMRHGLLISSFSDGVAPNPQVHDCLRRGLVRTMLLQTVAQAEEQVESSVKFSPCAGPDVTAVDRMLDLDTAIKEVDNHPGPLSLLLANNCDTSNSLRVLYIPTAMYALRPDSENTPGKQRQRARADGKKRRDELVRLLQNDVLHDRIPVEIVTLDFDDGSIKQPESTSKEGETTYPKDGKEAFHDWDPHLIYVQGGNTFWLYHCMQKGNWTEALLERARSGRSFYIGASAGAIVACAQVDTACWKGWDDPRVVPDRTTYGAWSKTPGMCLLGNEVCFFPHMGQEWEGLIEEKLQDQTKDVLALRDTDVCFIDGAKRSIRWFTAPNPQDI